MSGLPFTRYLLTQNRRLAMRMTVGYPQVAARQSLLTWAFHTEGSPLTQPRSSPHFQTDLYLRFRDYLIQPFVLLNCAWSTAKRIRVGHLKKTTRPTSEPLDITNILYICTVNQVQSLHHLLALSTGLQSSPERRPPPNQMI